MQHRDFFAFCTSLKPVERRAIGELSYVRRAVAGEAIYRPGAAADTLYIINLGVIEMVPAETTGNSAPTTYLSRGDIFGDLEVFTAVPRRHLARARDVVSLQSFEARDFPELMERVPTFFRYLAEQLARRLVQAGDAASAQSRCLQLSGSLANFDLVTVYQTIVNSAQTGELSIRGADGELVCTFFFEGGNPRCGQFQHLTGEEAFWQLFLDERSRGSFSFAAGATGISHSTDGDRITRHPGDMLINALQLRDELHVLKDEMPDASAVVRRRKSTFVGDEFQPKALRVPAEQIWQRCERGEIPLSALYKQLAVSELTIYRAVRELTRSGHVEVASAELPKKVA